MTPDDLDTIEGRLGVELPPEYRELLAKDPAEWLPPGAAYELFGDPRFVIDETTNLRLGRLGESRPPGELLAIGDDGCGNYCCLDLSQTPAVVVGYDHETDSYQEIAWSLDRWRKSLLRRAGGGDRRA